MEGFVPGAVDFFLETTPDLLATNIPKHTATLYFAMMSLEEWAANSTVAHEFSYDALAAREAKDATVARLWSATPGMMTHLHMDWAVVVYRGSNKLHLGVNGQHNADIMESCIVVMAHQLELLI